MRQLSRVSGVSSRPDQMWAVSIEKAVRFVFVFNLMGCGVFGSSPSSTAGATAQVETAQPSESTEQTESSQGTPDDPSMAGLSLRQRNYAREQWSEFQETVAKVRNRCGFVPESSIDWAAFSAKIDERLDGTGNWSLSGYCGVPLEWVERQCRNDNQDAANAFRQRVQSYRCTYVGVGQRSIRLEGSRLSYAVDFEATNDERAVDEYLGRNL